MKKIFVVVLGLISTGIVWGQEIDVVPAPVEVKYTGGVANVENELGVVIGSRAFTQAVKKLDPAIKEEAYRLTLTDKGYRIEAMTEIGVIRAKSTLSQLGEGAPACVIFDYPRFTYRGFMLDISRHFRTKDFIIKQIEALATLKINVLHLHLTDAAGWRIQIDRYPRLTSQAAWRVGETWQEWCDRGYRYSTEGAPDAYGGYLTKDDVREILAAADKYAITVIPEIEMPGHSQEVVRAYPEVGCYPTSDDLCPGKEATFEFLEGVLDEIIDLFPSHYIHIGGDEAGKADWHNCPDCQARMKAEGLSSVEELQSYLVRRIETYLRSRGRDLIGWDEILEGGLSPNATVMSWRGTQGGIDAMKEGHDAIMTPGGFCYFDKAQDAPVFEPKAIGGCLPFGRVASYDPEAGIPEECKPYLKGLQANLWHEYIPEPYHTEYMTYPRIAALAETGWSPAGEKKALRERAIKWADSLRDGSLTGKTFKVFDLRAERGQRPESLVPAEHLARGKKVIYTTPWHPSYVAGAELALTDGRRGDWSFADGAWQGFLSDVDVTVDLGSVMPVHYAGATFLSEPGPWIFLPRKVTILLSEDGVAFREAAVIDKEVSGEPDGFVTYGSVLSGQARYVRIKADRYKEWLFVDEIIVN